MPSSMPQPSSKPKPAFERVNRTSTFRPHQSLIEKLYIQDGRELKWIMEYMKVEYGLNLSVKQYKSQFKNWGLRHNLTQRDAAFILRLLDQARKEGRPEVVIYSGYARRRDYISKYIKRNEKLADESDLLSCISDEDETPQHIKLQEFRVEPKVPKISQFPPTPPSSSPSSSGRLQTTGREISPMRVPISTPEYTPRSSGEWSAAELGAMASADGEAMPSPFSHVAARLHAHNPAIRSQPTAPSIVDPFSLDHTHVPPEVSQSWDNGDTGMEWQAELTHAALSVTPAVVKQLSDLDLNIDRLLGDQIRSPQLKDGSHQAYFVMYCLYWLIYAGQDEATFQSDGEYALNSALVTFLCMLTSADSPPEDCLGALSIAAALFECYGQRERLGEVLMRCDKLTKKHYGSDNPLTKTIEFMGNMLAGSDCPPHDIPRLAQIVDEMQVIFFESPRPALTARYHLVWAMLENELKQEVRAPQNFEPVRRELEDLTKQCEIRFGDGRIETIMAAATLSRATFWCGDGVKAERILSRDVMPRVRNNFVESHPYVWEAKHRHAYFLFQLAQKEPGAIRLARLQHSESVLREVVAARCRVLGESNPKSKWSSMLLRDILKAQDQEYTANHAVRTV